MNTGIISSRYADTLLAYVKETGNGDLVCHQAEVIEAALLALPEFRKWTCDQESVPKKQKLNLFESALGGEKLCDDLRKFLSLVITNDREELLVLILHGFVDRWLDSIKVVRATITTAEEVDDAIVEKLKSLSLSKTGYTLRLNTRVNPKIVGGFIFETDGYMVNASVKRQLQLIKSQFIEKNRRIV